MDSLRADLILEGFNDLEFELLEGAPMPLVEELSHYYKASGDASRSWGFLSKETRNSWPNQFAFLFAHKSRRKDLPEKISGHICWTNYPEAALDCLILKLVGTRSNFEPRRDSPKDVIVEPSAYISKDVVIGEGSVIEVGVKIGARAQIGRNCHIGAYSIIEDDCILGDGCDLGSHCHIGGRGFGIIDYPRAPQKRIRHHVGRVRLGNFVQLGSHTCVDRAVFNETILGDEVSTDNHVQIAHNCVIGAQSAFCAFVGMSGSTTVGKRCVFAGASGTKGHLSIGDDVIVGAQSGITSDLESNQFVKGYPPRPIQEALKIESLKTRLPEIYSRLKRLEKLAQGSDTDLKSKE